MPSRYEVTPAVSGDEPGIIAVIRHTWLVTYPNEQYGITVADIAETLDAKESGAVEKWRRRIDGNDGSCVWVVRDGGAVVGFVYAARGQQVNKINAIYVLPGYQHVGMGTLLLETAMQWLGNARDIALEVVTYNTPAIAFYKRFGFTENGPTTSPAAMLSGGKELPEMEMRRTANHAY